MFYKMFRLIYSFINNWSIIIWSSSGDGDLSDEDSGGGDDDEDDDEIEGWGNYIQIIYRLSSLTIKARFGSGSCQSFMLKNDRTNSSFDPGYDSVIEGL